jgi:hypothetical protein
MFTFRKVYRTAGCLQNSSPEDHGKMSFHASLFTSRSERSSIWQDFALLFASFCWSFFDILFVRAHARITAESPILADFELQKVDGIWLIQP